METPAFCSTSIRSGSSGTSILFGWPFSTLPTLSIAALNIFQGSYREGNRGKYPDDMPIPVSRDAIEFEAQDFRAVQTVLLTGISGHDVLATELGNDSVDQVFPCASARVHAVAITGLAIEKELVGIFQVAVGRIE